MTEPHLNWQDLQLFLAVAQSGSLVAASQKTGKSPATLSRRMKALEMALNAELFIRDAQNLRLTPAGDNVFEKVLKTAPTLEALGARDPQQRIQTVKISAGTWTSQRMQQKLHPFMKNEPQIRLHFRPCESTLNISKGQTHLGLRNHRPTKGAYATRRLARVEFALYSSKVESKSWIKLCQNTPSAQWIAAHFSSPPCVETTNPREGLQFARMGLGSIVLPTFIGDQESDLTRASDEIAELAHDQWLVMHQDDRHRPAIRRTVRAICRVFQNV